jgi:hypothetical protein
MFISQINWVIKPVGFKADMKVFYCTLLFLCMSIIMINKSLASDDVNLNVNGFHGYMVSYTDSEDSTSYRYGMSFYSSVWPVSDRLTKNLQVGMASSWLRPNNNDNTESENQPLCPVGTISRAFMPELAYNHYQDVFQTVEGGVGIWAGTRFQTGYPKFAIGTVPNCYNDFSNTPGVQPDSFDDRPHMYGIAQLSNKLIIPPDGLTFKGKPNGELFGYGYLALPFTKEKYTDVPVGNQSWTLFVNTANFKGPVAFPIPDYWVELSKKYAFIEGRGLDVKPYIQDQAATMEFGNTPALQAKDNNGDIYIKIPQIQYPMNNEGNTLITQDLVAYSKDALFNQFEYWKQQGVVAPTQFDTNGMTKPKLIHPYDNFEISGIEENGIDNVVSTTIFEDNSFGLTWHIPEKNGMGLYPKYFKKQGDILLAIKESEVPAETNLVASELPTTNRNPQPYEVDDAGKALFTDHTTGPFTTRLNDCSVVTYYWYKFIDQPSIKKYNLSTKEKQELQNMVEKIHMHWSHTDEYMAPPSKGELVSFDDGLIVEPPKGLEVGYVPIVVKQALDCALPSKINLPWTSEEDNKDENDKVDDQVPKEEESKGGGAMGWWIFVFLWINAIHKRFT